MKHSLKQILFTLCMTFCAGFNTYGATHTIHIYNDYLENLKEITGRPDASIEMLHGIAPAGCSIYHNHIYSGLEPGKIISLSMDEVSQFIISAPLVDASSVGIFRVFYISETKTPCNVTVNISDIIKKRSTVEDIYAHHIILGMGKYLIVSHNPKERDSDPIDKPLIKAYARRDIKRKCFWGS